LLVVFDLQRTLAVQVPVKMVERVQTAAHHSRVLALMCGLEPFVLHVMYNIFYVRHVSDLSRGFFPADINSRQFAKTLDSLWKTEKRLYDNEVSLFSTRLRGILG
jgi:hypothetical protein